MNKVPMKNNKIIHIEEMKQIIHKMNNNYNSNNNNNIYKISLNLQEE
jgi:hypothetical protein